MNAKKLMTAAMMTLGLAAVPTIASAHERYGREERVVVVERPIFREERVVVVERRDHDFVESLRYAYLPDRIQEAVDFERRGNPVDHIQRVREGGREFYQMVIYGRRCDVLVRLGWDGRLLSREEVACERADVHDYHRYDREPYARFHVRWER